MPDENVFVDPVMCSVAVKRELNRRLMLFFTGETREARQVLARQSANTHSNLPALRRLCTIACEMREVLTLGRDLNVFGRLLHDAWQVKKTLEKTISNSRIDQYYEQALAAGALGGKLLGAVAGDFCCFSASRITRNGCDASSGISPKFLSASIHRV
jgi:D-glycero-alpha-D-manno-heptose-7-phosphate kinase